MTTLSVIIPVRDGAAHLADTLASLTRNSRPDFEFLVIDDGSVDETPEIVDDHRRLLPTLTLLRNPTPVGVSAARNLALSAAKGRLVTFLDGDDFLAPGYLPRLVAAIDALGCDFVRVDHVEVKGRRRTPVWAPEVRRNVVVDPRGGILPVERPTMIDYPFCWAGIYRRELGPLLRFDDALHTAGDRAWIWRLHREASSYAVVSLMGLFYRRLIGTSLTRIGDERQLHFLDSFALVFGQLQDDREFLPKAIRQFLGILARHLTIERLEPGLRDVLLARGRAAIDALPVELVTACELHPGTADALRALLPAGHPSLAD